jgi:hypothetical protein
MLRIRLDLIDFTIIFLIITAIVATVYYGIIITRFLDNKNYEIIRNLKIIIEKEINYIKKNYTYENIIDDPYDY